MANSRVARSARGAASYSANASGLAVDSDTDQLELNIDGTRRPLATSAVKVLTASYTATAAESGTTFIINSADPVTVTLPATASGLRYTMVIKVLSTSGVHAFSPASVDKIFLAGGTAADNKDLQSAAAADAIGDSATIVGDGVDGWYVVAVTEGTPDNWVIQS